MADPPQLYLKHHDDDLGNRPIPNGTVYWLSPSIWLDSPHSTTDFPQIDGARHDLYVKPWRTVDGATPVDIHITTWICNPTTKVGPDGTTLDSGGGSVGRRAIINAGAAFPLAAVRVDSWQPAAGDFDVNQGHVCIAANMWADGGTDGQEQTTGFLDVQANRHHAQLNIVLTGARPPTPTSPGKPGSIPIFTPKQPELALADGGEGRLYIREVPPEEIFGLVAKEHLLRNKHVELEDRSDSGSEDRPPHPAEAQHPSEPRHRAHLRAGAGLLMPEHDIRIQPATVPPAQVGFEDGGRLQSEVPFAPRSGAAAIHRFVCELDKADPLGSLHEFDVVLATDRDPMAGGVRILVVNMPWCTCCF